MSVQITVRITDEAAQFLAERSAATSVSRASIISQALHREQRRLQQERDRQIYASEGDDPELEAFTRTNVVATAWQELDR